jgi:hypothetical protein
MAFQALAIVMAPAASAAVTCSFSGGVMTINTDPGDAVSVQQNTVSGTILVNGAECTPVAPIATTTAINVNGDTGNESLTILMYSTSGATIDWGTVNWTVNLGSHGAAPSDILFIDNSGGDDAIDVTLGVSGIDLNTDGDLDVAVAGVETTFVFGGPDDDTISAAGDTATGAAYATTVFLFGFAGDDTLTGGAGNDSGAFGGIFGDTGDDTVAGGAGDDLLNGGADTGVVTDCTATGGDWVDYSGSAAAVNVNLATTNATGEGLDTVTAVENIIGSTLGDTLTGDGGNNVITPGLGDDKVDGGAGTDDRVDYSDATAAVTVDFSTNAATGGSGNDTLTSIENADGSDFDDTFIDQTDQDNVVCAGGGNDAFDQGASSTDPVGDLLAGEGGTDTLNYGARTSDLLVTLNGAGITGCGGAAPANGVFSGETNEFDCLLTTENANLGTGDDSFTGNEFNNIVLPGGGQNVLDGNGGSDTLDYSNYTAGVVVNMAGGATAGDSATDFENAIGSDFKDNITGNDLSNTLKSGKGNDNVKGGGGDDTVRGAGGKDILRGGTGDDDLYGGAGNDQLNGGGGTDFCNGGPGKDKKKSCELGPKG